MNYKIKPGTEKLIADQEDFFIASEVEGGFLLSSFYFFDFGWLKNVKMKNPKWALKSFTEEKGFIGDKILFAYTKTQFCFVVLPDSDEDDIPDDFVWKIDVPCQQGVFSPINANEKIMKIKSVKNSHLIAIATNQRIYYLDKTHKEMLIASPKNRNLGIKSVHFISESRAFFINERNQAMHISKLSVEFGASSVITIAKEDPLDSPFLLDTNGEFVLIRELSPYTKSYIYNIVNSSLTVEDENNWYQIFENNSYSTGLSHNNTIILYGENNYMIYKTDFEGFIKTRNIVEENLIGVIYDNERGRNSLIKFSVNKTTGNILRQREVIEKLTLNCAPRPELFTIYDHKTQAIFLTYLKKNEMPSGSEEFGGDSEGEFRHLAHRITWVNKINGYGIATWGVLGLFFILGIILIIFGIRNGRKQDKELEEAQKEWRGESKNIPSRKMKKSFGDVFNKINLKNQEDKFASHEVYYSFTQSDSLIEEHSLQDKGTRKKRLRSITDSDEREPNSQSAHSYTLRKKAATQN